MIKVKFDPAALTGADAVWWAAWKKRADKARDKVVAEVAAGKEPKFNEAIWKELKEKLLVWVFHGKCAYCESLVTGVTDNPAAEHFRPKRSPTVLDASGKQAVAQYQGKDHPGYYWLAYDWRNLLPACSQCNSNGKGNAFPVKKPHVGALDPTREDPAGLDALEEPLFLHPYWGEDPRAHLRFGEKGVVGAINGSAMGEASIKGYQLDREGLQTLRDEKQQLVWLRLMKIVTDGDLHKLDLSPYKLGRETYSAAVLDYVQPKLRELMKKLAENL